MPNVVPKPPDQPVALLRCTICDKLVKLLQSDLDRYMKTKEWPRCCGEVMTLFVPQTPPKDC